MHEFSDNNSYDNDGIPEGRFTFEQISAMLHMKYLYYQDTEMPDLAGQALTNARQDMADLEGEVRQIEEAEAESQLEQFFSAYNADFEAFYCSQGLGADEYPYEPEEVTNLSVLGDEFSMEQQMLFFGMRHEYEDNAQGDEAKIVAEGRITQGEMLLVREAERMQKLERLRQLYSNGHGYVLGQLFDGETPAGEN